MDMGEDASSSSSSSAAIDKKLHVPLSTTKRTKKTAIPSKSTQAMLKQTAVAQLFETHQPLPDMASDPARAHAASQYMHARDDSAFVANPRYHQLFPVYGAQMSQQTDGGTRLRATHVVPSVVIQVGIIDAAAFLFDKNYWRQLQPSGIPHTIILDRAAYNSRNEMIEELNLRLQDMITWITPQSMTKLDTLRLSMTWFEVFGTAGEHAVRVHSNSQDSDRVQDDLVIGCIPFVRRIHADDASSPRTPHTSVYHADRFIPSALFSPAGVDVSPIDSLAIADLYGVQSADWEGIDERWLNLLKHYIRCCRAAEHCRLPWHEFYILMQRTDNLSVLRTQKGAYSPRNIAQLTAAITAKKSELPAYPIPPDLVYSYMYVPSVKDVSTKDVMRAAHEIHEALHSSNLFHIVPPELVAPEDNPNLLTAIDSAIGQKRIDDHAARTSGHESFCLRARSIMTDLALGGSIVLQ